MAFNDDSCFPSTSACADERNFFSDSIKYSKISPIDDQKKPIVQNYNQSISLRINPQKSWKIGFRLLLMTVFVFLASCPFVSSQKSQFSLEDRNMMKKMILQKLGLEEMMQVRRGTYETSNHHIPLYIYDFLERAKEGELELLRHYMPDKVIHHSNPETQGWFVLYNLSATGRKPENELIVKADLRLRLGKGIPSAEEYRRQAIIEDDEEDEPALVTTSWEKYNVYEVDPELREVHRLLDTRFIPEDSLRRGDRWVDFDITTALTGSRRGNERELVELYIERMPADRSPMVIDLRDSAALIVQLETPFAGGNGRPRRKRDAKKKKGKRRKQHHSMPEAKDLCRLESLWIDFKDLDWHEWIISPTGYQAFQCRGKCTDMPPSARQNYTNHAVMQSLIHSLNSSAVPPPCCVPTEMSSLSILFKDSRNITVVHNYPQMIVGACGCH